MDRRINSIRDILIQQGEQLFKLRKRTIAFTGENEIDYLLNDLNEFPHAFVIACIMDRQIKAERAWSIPYLIKEKIGSFSMKALGNLSRRRIKSLLEKPNALHRFTGVMSSCLFKAIERINYVYDGNASRIWTGKPSSALVVYRFLEFDGVGPKIASMAANILARQFKIKFSDYYNIDISPDIHVKRVFKRLGLVSKDSSNEQLIFMARALHPEFPGIFDFPAWDIGREWCRPTKPKCDICYMNKICSKIL